MKNNRSRDETSPHWTRVNTESNASSWYLTTQFLLSLYIWLSIVKVNVCLLIKNTLFTIKDGLEMFHRTGTDLLKLINLKSLLLSYYFKTYFQWEMFAWNTSRSAVTEGIKVVSQKRRRVFKWLLHTGSLRMIINTLLIPLNELFSRWLFRNRAASWRSWLPRPRPIRSWSDDAAPPAADPGDWL